MTLRVEVSPLAHHAGLELPSYATDGAAGLDLRAAPPDSQPITLRPGERRLVPTGLRLAIPPGYEGQVRPRSGLALRHGVTCLNSPGTVDSDYRGEVGVILVNLGQEDFIVRRGERIAQLVFAPCTRVEWAQVAVLDDSPRGQAGFGSTGRG